MVVYKSQNAASDDPFITFEFVRRIARYIWHLQDVELTRHFKSSVGFNKVLNLCIRNLNVCVQKSKHCC
jgi:hypothetical protein